MTAQSSAAAVRTALKPLAHLVDTEALSVQLGARAEALLTVPRVMPAPIWAQRGFQFGPSEAWPATQQFLDTSLDRGPMAVYIHIPFCNSRCPFCDCYAVRLPRGEERRMHDYVAMLLGEIGAWSRIGHLNERPISTVHFGGGTPDCLPAGALERISFGIRDTLCVREETEWAIESTTSRLAQADLVRLRTLGFTRLHVGVQSLNDAARKRLGRRQSGADALAAIARAIDSGLVVSADMLYGVPMQDDHTFLASLNTLAASAIDGISLYQLHRTRRNERFFRSLDLTHAAPLHQLVQFASGHELLVAQHGFVKNHFCHFARPRDINTYYRHALRGEDLLALGATADGVFGPLCYRHGDLSVYLTGGVDTRGLEGCLLKSGDEHRIDLITARLLANAMTTGLLVQTGLHALHNAWLAAGWIADAAPRLPLTACGSWSIAAMIDTLRATAIVGNRTASQQSGTSSGSPFIDEGCL
jgi:coproporphyrinogen III oxidase-like Fe-S oxidoreductase